MAFALLDAGRKPGIMFDVGAHVGTALLPFAQAGWIVKAFEPDDTNRTQLEATIANRNLENVQISSLAVSDEARDNLPFFTSRVSNGISTLTPFDESHQQTQFVSTTTLQQVLDMQGLSRIDFLKIDVEGHEMAVLKGFDIEKTPPEVIVAEFEDRKTQSSANTLAEFLADHGYNVLVSEWHPIERYGAQHAWRSLRRYPCEISTDAWGNLIAMRSKISDAIIERSAASAMMRPTKLRAIRQAIRRAVGYMKGRKHE